MANQTFNRILGALDGLPDVTQTAATTVRSLTPLVGAAQTFIVQTVRQAGVGDTIFLEHVDAEGSLRLVIPPRVADTIARQRDALTKTVARKNGRRIAAERKARGEAPAFLKAAGARGPRRVK